jgi:lipopolysaccharide export system ATP-binding protein
MMHLPRRQQTERLESALDELGLAHLRDHHAYTLSGGERRRVEIARAMVTEPKFMLLDEPFSGVDPKAVEDLQGIIRQMRTKGLGVLITDHSVRETLTVTDRAYIIHQGKVMVSGTARELIEDPRARELYFGDRFYMQLDDQERPEDAAEDEEPESADSETAAAAGQSARTRDR